VYSDVLDYLNMIFTGVFTIEFILKLYAFRIKVSSPGFNLSRRSKLNYSGQFFVPNDDPYQQKTQPVCCTATMRICLQDFAAVRYVVPEFIA